LLDEPKKLFEIIQMFQNGFYWYQYAANKYNVSMIPFHSLKTCFISQTEPLTILYPPKMPQHTNNNNVNLMPFHEIFLVITLLRKGKKNVPEEKEREMQCMLACLSQIGKMFYSATVLT
jgi:hypothetical protein